MTSEQRASEPAKLLKRSEERKQRSAVAVSGTLVSSTRQVRFVGVATDALFQRRRGTVMEVRSSESQSP